MGCVHPATGRVIAHRTPPRVPEKVRHVVVSVARRFVDPPPRTPWRRTKYFQNVGVRHGAHGGWGGRKSQKIDFWKFVLYRSCVLPGDTGHLLRPLGVSRALLDHPEPLTGRICRPVLPPRRGLGRVMSKIHENLEKSQKSTFEISG